MKMKYIGMGLVWLVVACSMTAIVLSTHDDEVIVIAGTLMGFFAIPLSLTIAGCE